jgi:hypothetical protein
MPVFNSRTVIELARGIRAFLKLEAGLTRGEIRGPDVSGHPASHAGELPRVRMRLEEKEREIAGLKQRLAAPAPRSGGVNPESVVWIFCSNRSGSTWLTRYGTSRWSGSSSVTCTMSEPRATRRSSTTFSGTITRGAGSIPSNPSSSAKRPRAFPRSPRGAT